jgi:DNA-binding winged helix-turn-helix (wHTH) protein/tetratricopeptide (TPR) repeat protein
MSAAASTPGRIVRFGRFELDVRTGELRKEGRKARLQEQPFRILLLLLQEPGEVVTRDALRQHLWPDNTFVDFDQGLNNAVRRLRDALRDSADSPTYVETLPRLGYRFIAPVEWIAESAAAAVDVEPPVPRHDDGPDTLPAVAGTSQVIWVRPAVAAAIAGVVVVLVVLAWTRLTPAAPFGEGGIARTPRAIREGGERGTLSGRRPADSMAYELYLKGRHAWNRRTAAALREAIGHFEQALALSPLFVDAYAGLAETYSLMSLYDDVPPSESFPRAKAAALKALALDPNRGEVHTTLAYIAHRFEWDWAAAEQSYKRALELKPEYATAHHWYAEFLIVTGRLDAARVELELARTLDPLSPRIALDVSLPDYFAGRDASAIEQARYVTKLHPGFAPAWLTLRQYCERLGRYDEAIAALHGYVTAVGSGDTEADSVEAAFRSHGRTGYWQRLLELADRQWPTRQTPAHRANMYAALGDSEQALAWLERALAERDDEIVWIAVEPWYETLRHRDRFREVVARLALPLASTSIAWRLQAASPPG